MHTMWQLLVVQLWKKYECISTLVIAVSYSRLLPVSFAIVEYVEMFHNKRSSIAAVAGSWELHRWVSECMPHPIKRQCCKQLVFYSATPRSNCRHTAVFGTSHCRVTSDDCLACMVVSSAGLWETYMPKCTLLMVLMVWRLTDLADLSSSSSYLFHQPIHPYNRSKYTKC